MENVFVKLNPIEAATLVRLAEREHERRLNRVNPAQGYSHAAWAMELGVEEMLLARLVGEIKDVLNAQQVTPF